MKNTAKTKTPPQPSLDETASRLRSFPQAEPGSDLAERILAAVSEEADRENFRALFPVIRDAKPARGLPVRVLAAVAEEADRELDGAAKDFPSPTSVEPSADLAPSILSAVGDEARRERRRVARLWRAALTATAAAAAVVVAISLPRGEATTSSAPQPARLVEASDGAHAATLAVKAADWLAAQQEEDGSWSPAETGGSETFRPALTALALMALQRHAPERHHAAIDRAAAALEAMQRPDGSFSDQPASKLYNHAFASYALFDAQARHGGGTTPVLRRAIDFALRSQNELGAWDYTARQPGNAAMSVWEIGLLMRARQAGWTDDAGHLRRGLAWLRLRGESGAFDYRETLDHANAPQSGSVTLTAMATATLLDAARDFPQLRQTADTAVASLRAAYDRADVRAAGHHYRDYMLSRVFRASDAEAEQRLTRQIVAQHSNEDVRVSAPWAADDACATAGGDIYATVMAMLSVDNG